jgi:hypothetical protein
MTDSQIPKDADMPLSAYESEIAWRAKQIRGCRAGPFEHNLIGIQLAAVAKHYGQSAANKIVAEHLTDIGWAVNEAQP